MSETQVVSVLRDGDVAIVRIDNPPVNALSHAVRAGLVAAFEAVDRDSAVHAAVLACAGRTFVAGADIKEFGKPPQAPWLTDVIAVLDRMTKPVVAAIHGTALGGGLELALGCHARVALASARLGLPEVKLGLLPGAGGTQRLPRAIGAVKALRMVVGGEPITAAQALADGLVDAVVDDDLMGAAVSVARRLAAEGKLRRLSTEEEKLDADRADRTAFEAAAAELTRRKRSVDAPLACIESVGNALDLPFAEALKRERELFEKLVAGDQSKAQRHVFFAERAAVKADGLTSDVKPAAVNEVAVIGAGTMGSGIAIAFADAGIRVSLVDVSDDALARGLEAARKHYADAVKRGRLSSSAAEDRSRLVAGRTDLAVTATADLVIEAVFEDMELKKEVFATLGRIAKSEAVLATNTSYLDVDAIAAASGRAASVAGMHFFSPANLMRLVEVVRGRETSRRTLATLAAAARHLGKVPMVVGNGNGFVGNRMLRQRNVAAERLLLEGALPQEIDAAMVDFGFPMGPFAASDLAGLDIGWRMRKALGLRAEIADALCERGRFGQKTGQGFYRYETGSRTPVPDDDVAALIAETSNRFGISRRPTRAGEIVERLVFPMINEGARILEEGIAARASDIDVIWVHGYGWPVWRGGPMYYADRIGLARLRDRLKRMVEETGDETLRPARLLERLIAEGSTFGNSGQASAGA